MKKLILLVVAVILVFGLLSAGCWLFPEEEKTITISWLESAIRYNADGTVLQEWPAEPIGPAILTQDNGGYYLVNIDEFFNVFMTPEMEPEGGIAIDETGLLTGWAKYSLHKLPTENIFVGQVEIIVYEDETSGTMVGTYTQYKYAYGTEAEVSAVTAYGDAIEYVGIVDGIKKWFVQYTDYVVYPL